MILTKKTTNMQHRYHAKLKNYYIYANEDTKIILTTTGYATVKLRQIMQTVSAVSWNLLNDSRIILPLSCTDGLQKVK